MNKQNTERLKSAITTILIAAFALIALGAVCAPAFLTYHYGWKWALCYPALFVFMLILSARIKKNRS